MPNKRQEISSHASGEQILCQVKGYVGFVYSERRSWRFFTIWRTLCYVAQIQVHEIFYLRKLCETYYAPTLWKLIILPEYILNFKTWWSKYFKNSNNKTDIFSILKYQHLQYASLSAGYVIVSEFINGFLQKRYLLQKLRAAVTPFRDKA